MRCLIFTIFSFIFFLDSISDSSANLCAPITCKPNQECRVSAKGGVCQCKPGYYESKSGNQCYRDCEYHSCLNYGKCSRGPNGRVCNCPEGYSGNQCENKQNTVSIGIAVGCSLAILVLIFTGGYILYKQRYGRGYGETDKVPKDVNMGNVNKVTVAVQGETRSQKAETFENPVAIESVKKEQDDGHKSTVEAEEKLRHEKDDCEEDSRL